MASIVSKVKKAATSYVSNVVGGAKIVASAVSSAAKSVGGANQSGAVLNATLLPGAKITPPKVAQPVYTVPGDSRTFTQAGLTSAGIKPVATSGALVNQPQQPVFSGPAINTKTGASTLKSSGGSSKTSSNSVSSSALFEGPSINNVTGASTFSASNFSSPSSFTGNNLSNNASSVPNGGSSIVGAGTLAGNNTKLTLPEPVTADYSSAIPPLLTPQEQTAADATKEKDKAMKDYLKQLTKAPSEADAYRKAQQETDILAKQQTVNDLTGQLNAIVNKGQANQLSLVGQGRGIPEAIIGGQQAQIGRETAIAALPVQAQLSAAQGAMESAEQNLQTLYKIYSEDAQREYEYRKEVKKTVYEFASEKEKRALEKLDKEEDWAHQEKQRNLSQQTELATMITKNGAPSALISSVMSAPSYANALAMKGITKYMTDPQERALKNAQIQDVINKNNATNDDLNAIADAIISGDQPPVLTGLYSKSAGVRAALAKKGYNLTKAQADWEALKKFNASSNSPQQLRMRQAESSVENSLGNLKALNEDYNRSGFKFVNKADLVAATNGIYGTEAAQKAQALLGQVALISDELGQTFMGGNSPTDAAFELVKNVFTGDFTKDVLNNQIKLLEQNLQYRKNSWATVQATGLGGANQYNDNDPMGLGIDITNNDPLKLGF